ncbi:acetate kinase [Vallitalea pronyensis]|uniref:Acetate kinase n=1 Tax=Vallitalea pronyensis TaxID=1348613 RepID=A0A8J8MPZ8_9FIRM|nr:acetate kinase [Vallitalea pronyensis]QUI25253.1 acetate kinase [Vallitalea pronyensis]
MGSFILALNCGSSSLKFTLFAMEAGHKLKSIMEGVVEEIGNPQRSRIKMVVDHDKQVIDMPLPTHHEALLAVFDKFYEHDIAKTDIKGVGHRVVHGGTQYNSSVLIDEHVIETIRELFPIAPLHNPPNLLGIEVAIELLPGVPQVAVFDTAFHASLPEYAYRYAIPEAWYKDFDVRTYGFHGTSHMYVAKRGAKFLGVDYHRFNGITAHLGNGCSLTKIEHGMSVDTSMGFTPLEGVIMGTRSGDIDPAVISHVVDNLMKKEGIEHEEAFKKVMHALNKESGLKALGGTNMMQDIRVKAQAGDVEAETVVAIYAYRIAKYIGAYWATLPSCEALIFTAGLGENEGYVRKKILGFLSNIQIEVDDERNADRKIEVQIGKSEKNNLSVLVIPTDEESVIGYDTLYIGHLGEGAPDVYPFELD